MKGGGGIDSTAPTTRCYVCWKARFQNSSIILERELLFAYSSPFPFLVRDSGCLNAEKHTPAATQSAGYQTKVVEKHAHPLCCRAPGTAVQQKKRMASETCCTGTKPPRCRRQVFPSHSGYNNRRPSSSEGSPLATSARCHATQTRIARKSKWQTQRNVTRLPTSPFLLGCFYVACSLTKLPSLRRGVSGDEEEEED